MEVITKSVFLILTCASIAGAEIVAQKSNGGLSKTASDSAYVNVTGDTMTGQLTLNGSSLTVTGNAFSVGTSTLVVSNGRVGVGLTPARNFAVSGGAATGFIQITNTTAGTASGDGGYISHDGTHMLIGNQEVGDATMFVRNTTDQSIKLTTLGAGANNASLTLKVSATTGGALCLNASNVLSKCTTQPDASGNCTCP